MKIPRSLAILALAACSAPTGHIGNGYTKVLHTLPVMPDKLDVLFVVDDSGSMADDQLELVDAAPIELFPQLQTADGSLPSLHVAVVSTSVTLPNGDIPECDRGDLPNGRFLLGPWVSTSQCTGITGNFLSDEPDGSGGRITNFTGTLVDNFSCIAQLGANGCGIEQPLQAMRDALDGSHPENAGFLRDDAMLLVVFLTDEDDSSAVDGSIWDLTGSDAFNINDREFEYGVTCDPDDASLGPRHDCVPRDNPTVIHGIGEYVDFLTALKGDPSLVMVAGINSPPGPVAITNTTPYGHGIPGVALAGACTPPPGPCPGNPTQTCPRDAVLPAVRLDAFLADFPSRYMFTSLCDGGDMEGRVHQIARAVHGVMTDDGCLLGTSQIAAGSCVAYDVDAKGTRARMSMKLTTDDTACEYTTTHLRASLGALPSGHHAEVYCLQ